ncbi:MAG: 30S ribosomal protein S7 [bacterium]
MRGKQAPKRITENDPVYKSKLITRLINKIMQDGKKSLAENIVYKALDNVAKAKGVENPLTVLEGAFANISPKQEVRSRRVGGANYQIPVSVRFDRAQTLSIRWLLATARGKKGKPMHQALSEAIIEAAENRGDAVKKKEDTHRMADANKAFAHFRW